MTRRKVDGENARADKSFSRGATTHTQCIAQTAPFAHTSHRLGVLLLEVRYPPMGPADSPVATYINSLRFLATAYLNTRTARKIAMQATQAVSIVEGLRPASTPDRWLINVQYGFPICPASITLCSSKRYPSKLSLTQCTLAA